MSPHLAALVVVDQVETAAFADLDLVETVGWVLVETIG